MRDLTIELITSDWHFGHANILTYCPARYDYLGLSADANAEEMNEALVYLWNSQVTVADTVYLLGDACMGKVRETLEYVKRLNGRKLLLLGNHDRPHPIATHNAEKRESWARAYEEAGFEIIGTGPFMWSFDGVQAKVCHFPFKGVDHSEDRYNADQIARFLPQDDGGPLVHGHVHDMFQTQGRMFNVGIDAWNGRILPAYEIGDHFRSLSAG